MAATDKRFFRKASLLLLIPFIREGLINFQRTAGSPLDHRVRNWTLEAILSLGFANNSVSTSLENSLPVVVSVNV